MRKLKALLLAAALLALAAVLAAPVGASPSATETIVLMRNGDLNEVGWSASGAFGDSGSWTTDFLEIGGGQSPTAAGMLKTTETGANGTFEMIFQLTGIPTVFGGTWQITDGTGAYADLHGKGTWIHSTDPVTGNSIFTCTGTVHFDP
jgi:hypothetical protein